VRGFNTSKLLHLKVVIVHVQSNLHWFNSLSEGVTRMTHSWDCAWQSGTEREGEDPRLGRRALGRHVCLCE